jgi:predicted nuclease of predicted toxin-antitoxin system
LLAGHGHDVQTVVDEELVGRSDEDVSGAATREGRALLTFDVDFADERAYPSGSHPGVVVLRLRSQDRDATLAVLDELLTSQDIDTFGGALVVVTESTVRVRRPLP